MNKALKTLISVLLVLTAVISPVVAATVSVNWQWAASNPYIQYFRYQLGGEAEDGWTVVRSDVTSYTYTEADPATEYTLYLQQSYDGIYWSDSVESTSVSPLEIPVYLPLLGNVEAAGGPGKAPVATAVRTIETTAGAITVNADNERVVITYPYGYDRYAAAFIEALEADYPSIMSYVTVTQSRSRLTGVYAEEINDQAMLDVYADALVAEIYARLAAGFDFPLEPDTGVYDSASGDVPAALAAPSEGSSAKGSWFIGTATRYQMPWKTWSSSDIASEKLSSVASEFTRTVIQTITVGYAPNDVVRYGLTAGFGISKYSDSANDAKLYIIPFSFDVDAAFFQTGDLDLVIGASLGGYVRKLNNEYTLGPQASVRLGLEYAVTEHVILGATTGLSLLGTYTDGKALKLELDFVPFVIGVRYQF